jgi:hypothetical protein
MKNQAGEVVHWQEIQREKNERRDAERRARGEPRPEVDSYRPSKWIFEHQSFNDHL